MERSVIEDLVKHTYAKPYRVKNLAGKTYVVRLWRSDYGVAKLLKGKKTHGTYLDMFEINSWVSIVPVTKKVANKVSLMKRRATDALSYLNQSGMWTDIKEEIEYFLSDDKIIEEVCEAIDKDWYENFYLECCEGGKFPWCHTTQVFQSFYSKECWKSIPYLKYERERMNEVLRDKILTKDSFRYFWINGYDNRISVEMCKDGVMRGWLSCEYRGCGNGHYYLLFDATHAIYYEDD